MMKEINQVMPNQEPAMCVGTCPNRQDGRLCPACEAEFVAYATDQNALSELIAADPENDPTFKPATDAEYREHYLNEVAPLVVL